ncbi:MAG: hypothetical protein ACHQNT_08635 [Bacteroidia bacterium]
MKDKIILTIAVITVLFSGNLVAQSFDKGDDVIGFGLGFGGHYGAYKNYTSQSPALCFMYEKGMRWDAGPGIIGLGAFLGYKSLAYKSSDPYYVYDYEWTYLIIGMRGSYHYEFTPNLDTYAGLLLSYNSESLTDQSYSNGYPYAYSGDSDSGIGLSLYLGARYYFSDQWAAFAELGYGIATLQLGAVYKF